MVLSNAQRQARHRARMKALVETAVTPDDVRRAVRLYYEDFAAEPRNRAQPFEDWLAGPARKKRGEQWREFVPDALDLDAYSDFAPDAAALLLKVAAVVRAVRYPPE